MFVAKQNTAATYTVGPILDSAGAEYAGAVIGDLSLSKNGGTPTALAAAATLTYIANGQYTLAMIAGNADTVGTARVSCDKATYQMPALELQVVEEAVYDALFADAAVGYQVPIWAAANSIVGLTGTTVQAVTQVGTVVNGVSVAVGGVVASSVTAGALNGKGDWLTSAGYTAPPSAGTIAAAVLAAGDVDGFTLEAAMKLCLAALAGELSGAGTTTVTIRAADDSKVRITATVDSNGNRTALTLDATG